MRALVLLAIPAVIFGWLPAAVRSAFVPECEPGQPQLLGLASMTTTCVPQTLAALVVASAIAAFAAAVCLAVRGLHR